MNTILLIEDNVNNVSLLEDIFLFDDIPARLVSVETGEEALNRAVEIQPVLILMDLRLPGIDGLETTQILKRNPLTKDIPVWAITAYAMNGDEERRGRPAAASTSPNPCAPWIWPTGSAPFWTNWNDGRY